MEIFTPKRLRIVGTIVARDEEDIIGPMIEHHLASGVTDLLATDNSSRDRTRAIMAKYPEVREITDSDDMSHNQEVHTTRMARTACKFGPDWIVHLDADEFWCNLPEIDGENHAEPVVWATTAYIHPPVPGLPEGVVRLDRMRNFIDFHGRAKEYKILHRPDPNIVVGHGNHRIIGAEGGYTMKVNRHHYPIRSYSQFERKVVQGARALQSRGFNCQRWNRWLDQYDAGILPDIYEMMAKSWHNMTKEGINELLLKKILSTCYNVEGSVCDQIFLDLQTAGLKTLVGRWVPSTFKRKPLL